MHIDLEILILITNDAPLNKNWNPRDMSTKHIVLLKRIGSPRPCLTYCGEQRKLRSINMHGSCTALPSVEHGFALHKGAFQDALALRYGWTPTDMPSTCACGTCQ